MRRLGVKDPKVANSKRILSLRTSERKCLNSLRNMDEDPPPPVIRRRAKKSVANGERCFPSFNDSKENESRPPRQAKKSIPPPQFQTIVETPVSSDDYDGYPSDDTDISAESDYPLHDGNREQYRGAIERVCAEEMEKQKKRDAELLRNLLQKNRQTALSSRERSSARVLSIHPDGDRKMPPSGSSAKKEDNSQCDETEETTRFGSKEPISPRHSIWVPIKRSFWTLDKTDLQFLPSLDGDQNMEALLAGFNLRSRKRMMKHGPPGMQAKVDELIDNIILNIPDEIFVGNPWGRGYPHLISDQIGQSAGRVQERYNAMIPAEFYGRSSPVPKPTSATPLRDLWCSRCCIYDCRRHGLPRKADPRVELVRRRLVLEDERAGKWEKSEVTSPTPDESTLSPCLSDGQAKMFEQVFQLFEGDLYKISLFLHVTVTVVEEYATTNNIVLPPELLQPVDFHADPTNKALEYYSIHNYNESWYSAYGEAKDRPEFVPCYHKTMCNESNCTCIQNNHFCTRACVWGRPENRNFFRGCSCKGRCVQRSCSCFAAARECDPNLCSCNCCAGQIGQTYQCGQIRNDNIFMERGPTLGIRKSNAKGAGYGCFTLTALQAGDYVGEYVGELISHDEAERRGAIADANKRSYLFTLTPDVSVDASRYGNETRFINDDPSDPNVEPRGKLLRLFSLSRKIVHQRLTLTLSYISVLFVQGEQRIAFFASQHIDEGEELFFDYRYSTSLGRKSGRAIDEKFPWLKDQKRPAKRKKAHR